MDLSNGLHLGIALGVTFGVLYGLTSFLTYRVAMRKGQRMFMVIAFGGMVVRLFVAVSAVVLVLLTAPVDATAFVLSFFLVFAGALAFEVVALNRQQARQALQSTA